MLKEVDMTQPNGDGVAGGRWYRFDSLGDLLACCRALKGRGLGHDGAAYIDEGGAGRYYLELREGREEGRRSPAIDLAAAEFGTLADREATELYLAEYGRCLCESGAVGMLGRC
jgi:negative regulator of genetic competence, sporulation and motility